MPQLLIILRIDLSMIYWLQFSRMTDSFFNYCDKSYENKSFNPLTENYEDLSAWFQCTTCLYAQFEVLCVSDNQ